MSRRAPRAPIPVAVALAVLAVLATVAPEPAAAQTVTTFISNTGQTANRPVSSVRATAFTTGTGTYTLSSVGIFIPSAVVGTPAVKIYGDTGGFPGTLLATRTNPGTFEIPAVNSFTAPANTTLSASTTYWVVTSNSAATNGQGFWVALNRNRTLDSGAAAGWSIGMSRSKADIAATSWRPSSSHTRFEIRGTNRPTVATAIPDQSATAGTAFSYVFPANTFSDADTGDTLSYTATKTDDTALPTWLAFTASTRTFSGTPQAADAGTVAVKVTASDGNGGSVSDAFDITVIISVPSNWTLKPTALAAGAKFRLLFLSSTKRDATATDIATYNTFVQTRAAAGHADIRDYSAGFRVVGCTAAVDARDNTATTYTTTDKGVPIYWLNGAKAADQYEDFYDGSWDDEANDKNESGTDAHDTNNFYNYPLTGCSHDGTEQWPLGAPQVSVGRPNSSGSSHGPLFANGTLPKNFSNPMYGLSAVFQVANTPATGAPTITGTAQVGQTLTAGTTAIMDADGLTSVSYTYQWIRTATGTSVDTNISGATASTYTLVAADLGTTIKVRVSFTDDASNAETLTSAATAAVSAAANTPATGAPTITGTAQVGQTLTATKGTIADSNGLHTTWFSNATTTLQWIRVDGGSDSDISSATDLTYTLVTADEGKQVKVKVDFTDDDGHDESLTSDAYPAGSTVLPVDMSGTTGVVSFSGDPTVGTALTATLSDPDNGVSGTPTWQWARSARPDTGFTDISSATGASYTPVEMDRAFFLRATATYSDGGGSGKTAPGTTALPVGITSGVFIKNTRQSSTVYSNNSPRTLYQGFRTGDNPAGYLLTLVLVGLGGNSGDPIEVQMYRRGPGESGFGSLVYELLPPTDIQSAGDHIVDAPPGAVLEPETDYFLRLTNLNFYTGTTSRNADGGAASGWAISGRASVPGLLVNNTLRILVRGMDLLGPPGPPGSLSATGVAGSAVLTWTAPGSTGQRPVTKYQVRHKQASDPDTAFSAWSDVADSDGDGDLADELSVSVSRPAGTEYTLEVRAVNTNGAGTGAQANVAATDLVPSNSSLIPTGLSTGDKFRLLFLSSTKRNKLSANIADYNTFVQTRAANGHADIRDYSAGFRAVGCTAAVDARDNTKTTYTTTDKGVPIYWLNGAKAADEYEDFYDGSWDDEANDKNESGTNGLDTSLNDNWPLTGCDHDGTEEFALGSSQVRVGRPNSSGSDHGPLSSDSLLGASLTRPLYGLSAVFEVAAAVVVPNNPPAFSADTAARSVAENTAAGQNVGAALTATDADSDTLTYTLEGTDAASFDIVSGSGQIRTRTGVTYNHEAKSTHTVVVKADDGNGGTDTVTVTITVTDVDEPPGQPAAPSVSATAGSTTSLDVTWTAPTNTGPAIASYDLQYRAGTSGNFTNGPQNVTGTSAAIGSLAADTSYEVQVRATNAEGDGDWSFAGTGRTTATSAPGAPTGLSATASGTTAINLSWSAPGSTGGAAITGYKIEVSPNGTSGWTDQVANTNSTATTYAHSGLAAGTTRHYRVSAINTNGAGTASNVDSATTGTTVPGAPTGLTATASGTTAINLSWSAPASNGGSAITGYKIEVSSNGTSSWTNLVANTSNTTTTYAHTGLTAGATRHYRVSAINANGAGTASNVANATTGQTTVTFGASSYTAAEGGATATVAVQLSAAASATVTIPLTKTHRGGATAADYSGVPSNVTFTAGQTRRTFTVTATDDADKDGGESVQLGFGTLPGGYAPGARRTATVTLVDDDANLIVNFGTERHTTVKVRESDTVWHRFTFSLSTSRYGPPNGNPQQPVTIPLVVTHRGGATPADYEVRGRRTLTSVTFGVGESVTSFSMRAIPDGRRETGEGLRLDFGRLPAGVRQGD